MPCNVRFCFQAVEPCSLDASSFYTVLLSKGKTISFQRFPCCQRKCWESSWKKTFPNASRLPKTSLEDIDKAFISSYMLLLSLCESGGTQPHICLLSGNPGDTTTITLTPPLSLNSRMLEQSSSAEQIVEKQEFLSTTVCWAGAMKPTRGFLPHRH